MNHEYILWLSLSDLSEPRIQSLWEDVAIYICATHSALLLLLFQAKRTLRTESPLQGSEQRLAVFQEYGKMTHYRLMASDNDEVSLGLDKPADA